MFLLDTNLISELRKARTGKADPGVVAWAERRSADEMFISVITVLELELGVQLRERRDPDQGRVLRSWLEGQVIPSFSDRTLPIEIGIARRCAGLQVPDPRPYRDALIAATALAQGFTLVTRNLRDFQGTGVELCNPWTTE